jgi:TRAP transporter TAXI family solute receptor
MMMKRVLAALLGATMLASPALADQGPVGVITGMPSGTYAATGWNLTSLDTPQMRVVVMLGKGSLQNLSDLLHLRGVDAAFVQGDALAYARAHNLFPPSDLAQIQYVAKLYDEEVHVLARAGVERIADLAGKTVNVDVEGSGSAMTAEILLQALGVNANVTHRRQADAVVALKNGEIDAIIHVGGAPIPVLSSLPTGTLHFVPVALTDTLINTYLPAEITHDEYPNLIPAGADPVQTIAVSDVLAVFGWSPSNPRYANVARLVHELFAHISDLQQPPNHPKWREVNLAATVPGWTRFAGAQAELDSVSQLRQFKAFAQARDIPPPVVEQLFQAYTDCVRKHLAACQ